MPPPRPEDAAVARAGFGVVERPKRSESSTAMGRAPMVKDVAQNAADAGGRALERLDETGVVVRFDLEGDHVAAADIDDAGVLAGTLDHQLAARGELLSGAGASSCRSSARSTSR
jgi:hypothetical protein